MQYKAVVVGVSAGGLAALKTILPALPATFPLSIIIVQHLSDRSDSFMSEYLNQASQVNVKEAEDKEPLQPNTVYLAPAGYHLLVEPELIFSLSVDPRVNFSCPSIDVLFESAAAAFGESLIGVVLTGANSDGANGLRTIKQFGGFTIVQNPETAESAAMPKAAMAATEIDHVVELEQLAPLLTQLTTQRRGAYGAGG